MYSHNAQHFLVWVLPEHTPVSHGGRGLTAVAPPPASLGPAPWCGGGQSEARSRVSGPSGRGAERVTAPPHLPVPARTVLGTRRALGGMRIWDQPREPQTSKQAGRGQSGSFQSEQGPAGGGRPPPASQQQEHLVHAAPSPHAGPSPGPPRLRPPRPPRASRPCPRPRALRCPS